MDNTAFAQAFFFTVHKSPLTVTLNWDTEMLFGWTLRRTHCLMSDAKRRGSDERSHFSFLVHLQETEGVLFTDDKYTWTWTHTVTYVVTRPGSTPFHLLATGKKRMSLHFLTKLGTFIIFPLWQCTSYSSP